MAWHATGHKDLGTVGNCPPRDSCGGVGQVLTGLGQPTRQSSLHEVGVQL